MPNAHLGLHVSPSDSMGRRERRHKRVGEGRDLSSLKTSFMDTPARLVFITPTHHGPGPSSYYTSFPHHLPPPLALPASACTVFGLPSLDYVSPRPTPPPPSPPSLAPAGGFYRSWSPASRFCLLLFLLLHCVCHVLPLHHHLLLLLSRASHSHLPPFLASHCPLPLLFRLPRSLFAIHQSLLTPLTTRNTITKHIQNNHPKFVGNKE